MSAIAFMVQAIAAKPAVYTKRANVPPVTRRVREVAEFVRATPGCSREAVALAFKCAARTAGTHLQAAKLNGLIRCDHKGRFSRWWPTEVV